MSQMLKKSFNVRLSTQLFARLASLCDAVRAASVASEPVDAEIRRSVLEAGAEVLERKLGIQWDGWEHVEVDDG